MKVRLTPSYALTTEHRKSSLGFPVLVNLRTDEAYNPSDMLEAYPTWGRISARDTVLRMANMNTFTEEERAFIQRFTGMVF